MDRYISWDSNAPSLSDKLTAYSNEDDEELQNQTPASLFQSIPIMAPRAMRALPPPNEHHVNHVWDKLLPADFHETLQEIAANPPNTQANLEELSDSKALLNWMFHYNLSPGQDSTNFLQEYTARYGADSRDVFWGQYNHVINRLGVQYHGYDNCHTRCDINATFYAVVVKLCPNCSYQRKSVKEPRVQVLCLRG